MVAALVAEAAAATLYLSPEANSSYVNVLIALLLGVMVAWLAGTTVRQRRDYRTALLTQAAAHAVTAERLRIARELHDMVAHSIGVIAIQAGVGSRVIDTQPDEAAGSVGRAIEDTSRETLAGLRRSWSACAGAMPTGRDRDRRAGGLDQLSRDAGRRRPGGRCGSRANRGRCPADVELAAYRIIQEAVTNVVRHAGTARCQVVVEYGHKDAAHRSNATTGGAAPTWHRLRHTGMRERVALLRRRVHAGPRPEGGFRVRATACPAAARRERSACCSPTTSR